MIKRLLRSVFPPPRRSLGWLSVLPLVVFLIVFGVGCVCLEWFDVLVFTAPGAFFLTAALAEMFGRAGCRDPQPGVVSAVECEGVVCYGDLRQIGGRRGLRVSRRAPPARARA